MTFLAFSEKKLDLSDWSNTFTFFQTKKNYWSSAYPKMLASLSKGRRFVRLTSSKSTNQVSLRLPQRVSMSKAAQGWTQVTFKDVKIRYYGSHLSHEEEPKVVISEPKFPEHKPVPVHLMDENKRKQQIEEVEGMIYGTQVTYINTTKHDDTYAESVNGWIFGRKVSSIEP